MPPDNNRAENARASSAVSEFSRTARRLTLEGGNRMPTRPHGVPWPLIDPTLPRADDCGVLRPLRKRSWLKSRRSMGIKQLQRTVDLAGAAEDDGE